MIDARRRLDDQGDLWVVLARAVRSMSDHVLVVSAIAGLGAVMLVLMFWSWPARAELVSAATVVSCFGFWGVADRAIADARTDRQRHVLQVVRVTIGVLGGAGAVVIGFRFMTFVVGKWVS